MALIQVEDISGIAILRLRHGVTNAIGPALVDDFQQALDEMRSKVNGLLLTGGEKFFSIGLDLPELLNMDRGALSVFWERFNTLLLDLYTFPVPVVCALNGHAIAGGTILALTADYRVSGTESALIGLNEIKLGVPVPYIADLMLRELIGNRRATKMIYSGEFINMAEAVSAGIIDDLEKPEQLEPAALKKIKEMITLPPKAFAVIKANRVEAVRMRFEQYNNAKNKMFISCWFDPDTQKLLKEAAEKF